MERGICTFDFYEARQFEARTLKWSDLDSFTVDDRNENTVLQVKYKTGAREVVSRTPEVKNDLQPIYELRTKERDGVNLSFYKRQGGAN